jgi:hypothetical protein
LCGYAPRARGSLVLALGVDLPNECATKGVIQS